LAVATAVEISSMTSARMRGAINARDRHMSTGDTISESTEI